MSNIHKILNQRNSDGLLRALKHEIKGIDFCSNDYLGFARSSSLTNAVMDEVSNSIAKNGASGSRLLSGNSNQYLQLEQQISNFHGTEDALVFSSGYQANIGLLQCVAQKGDTLILDELIHASLIDGARLSHAKRFKFAHNDLTDLRKKLEKASGDIYVVVESLYSMDGDISDIKLISDLCLEYHANLIVDEAHSAGVYGPLGAGLVSELDLESHVFARIITYGKAFGIHAAAIVGSKELKGYLINFSRSFIYSTGLPPYQLVAIKQAYLQMEKSQKLREQLFDNISYFKSQISIKENWIESNSPIQSLVVPGNEKVKSLEKTLHDNNFEAFPILSPTVAKGKERIRFCLHAFNTHQEIDQLFQVLNTHSNDN